VTDPQHSSAAPQASAIPSAYNANVQQDFMSRMLPHAMQANQSTGVPPQLMLGQAALESGWGKREIRMADGSNSYNLFGIKANAGWNGKVAEVMTTEYKNGIAYKQVEKFRAYSSYAESFQDYANMISQNPRYAGVLQQGMDATGLAQAIQKAGYATDPNYADKLARVMAMINSMG
jgi:flagellar protein FlgJ